MHSFSPQQPTVIFSPCSPVGTTLAGMPSFLSHSCIVTLFVNYPREAMEGMVHSFFLQPHPGLNLEKFVNSTPQTSHRDIPTCCRCSHRTQRIPRLSNSSNLYVPDWENGGRFPMPPPTDGRSVALGLTSELPMVRSACDILGKVLTGAWGWRMSIVFSAVFTSTHSVRLPERERRTCIRGYSSREGMSQ